MYAAESDGFRLAESIADTMKIATDGRLVLEPYVQGAIVPSSKELEGVDQGAVEIASTYLNYSAYLFPACEIFAGRPGGLTSSEMHFWMSTEEAQDLVVEMLKPLNVHYVSMQLRAPTSDVLVSKVPLKTVDDFKGLKFRTAASSLAEILTEMDAAPANVPWGEIYDAMVRGVIDATECGDLAINWDMAMQEVADYHYITESMLPGGFHNTFVNGDSWTELGPDIQEILKHVTISESYNAYVKNVIRLSTMVEQYRDYGVTVEYLPSEIEMKMKEIAKGYYSNRSVELGDPMYTAVLESQERVGDIYESVGI